ncbi:hypothetical protein HPG69_009693 [Diceros bicornis minor]|uniref:Uncharacterized protein n=1 Tax=Diceros bicornis minor TaxID=77932 RepID=A0A7J7EX94_DICBM|nr:hypothetical protein HPG69_009693 [Diceros bicornis minor]
MRPGLAPSPALCPSGKSATFYRPSLCSCRSFLESPFFSHAHFCSPTGCGPGWLWQPPSLGPSLEGEAQAGVLNLPILVIHYSHGRERCKSLIPIHDTCLILQCMCDSSQYVLGRIKANLSTKSWQISEMFQKTQNSHLKIYIYGFALHL